MKKRKPKSLLTRHIIDLIVAMIRLTLQWVLKVSNPAEDYEAVQEKTRSGWSTAGKVAAGIAVVAGVGAIAQTADASPTMSIDSYNSHVPGQFSLFQYSVSNDTPDGTQLDVIDQFRIDNFDTSGILGYQLDDATISEIGSNYIVIDSFIQPGNTDTFTFYISPEFDQITTGIADGMSTEGYLVTGEWDFNDVNVPTPSKVVIDFNNITTSQTISLPGSGDFGDTASYDNKNYVANGGSIHVFDGNNDSLIETISNRGVAGGLAVGNFGIASGIGSGVYLRADFGSGEQWSDNALINTDNTVYGLASKDNLMFVQDGLQQVEVYDLSSGILNPSKVAEFDLSQFGSLGGGLGLEYLDGSIFGTENNYLAMGNGATGINIFELSSDNLSILGAQGDALGMFGTTGVGYNPMTGDLILTNGSDMFISENPTIAVPEGDINFDRKVDLNDLNIMAENWLSTNTYRSHGDLNNDGSVNLEDFSVLAGNWLYGAE